MKIQKLTIHNIASIVDAVIDFEASPLAESEVFLITGDTGSGKSTILDAICLALYANTPRLRNTEMEGGTKDGNGNITIKDPRQLMRKNTGEASVSLTFTGNNGVHLKATWSVTRAHKKPSGNLQAKDWVLENLDTGKRLEKDAEIREEIKSAIGLEFDQFCRTTILAQGEFTRFLNSPDKDKAEILEKITGVDTYSKIGEKVYTVTGLKKADWETAQKLVEETHNPTEEEIAAKQKEIEGLNAEYETYKQQHDREKAKQQWIKTDNALTEEVSKTQSAYDEALRETQSETFKEKETLVRQWNETIEARSWLSTKKRAEDRATQLKGTLKALSHDFVIVLSGYEHAEQEWKQAETERDKLPEVKPEEEAQAKQKVDELRKQFDDVRETLRNITTACDRIEAYTTARALRAEAEKHLQETYDKIEKKKEEVAKLERELHDAEVKRNAQKELFEQQKDTIDKFAQTIRQRLKTGDVCPVCRQKIISELPHEAELSQLVEDLRKGFEDADLAYTDLLKIKNRLDAEIQASIQAYQTSKEAFDKDTSLTIAKQKVVEACKACGIETLEATTPQKLESLKIEKGVASTNLEKAIKEWEKKVADYQELSRQRQTLSTKLARISDQCLMTKETIDDILRMKPDWKDLKPTTAEALPDLPRRANDLKSRTASTIDQLGQAETAIKEHGKLLGDFLKSHEEINMERLSFLNAYTSQSVTETNTWLNAIRNKVLTAETLKKGALKKQEEHKNARPEINEDDTLITLETRLSELEEAMKAIAEKKGALHQELTTYEKNKERYGQLLVDADRKKADYQKWSRLNQLIGDATGSKFRKIAQSYVLSSLIHSANSYMETLTNRYTLKVTPGTFVISIEDAYQGYASRAASTISGGESFLVSLSLALALSDIGQRLAVDTLFIDEGFGTLSGDPLQNAINTLRTLQTKSGRHVGIISHVEELKEKIAVQIQVEQEPNNSSSTIKVVTT